METNSAEITIQGRASDGQITTPKRERARPAPQPPLPTRKELDLRVAANKHFAQIVNTVVADLGEARVSTVQEGLIEAWAGCRINLDILNARLLRGEPVNQTEFNNSISNLVALSQSLGLNRAHAHDTRGEP